MSDKPFKRFHIWTPILFALVLVIGLMLGFQANRYFGKKRTLSSVMERDDRLEEMISLINQKYVDPVNSDSLYANAVNGILSTLDPHTIYIPAKELADMNEPLDGNYKGVGLDYEQINDTVYLSAVTSGGPAQQAGIHAGDQLLAVNGRAVSGVHFIADSLEGLMKGAANTPVMLAIKRPSENKRFDVRVLRRDVNIPSVEASYIMDNGTGYIRICRFSNNTVAEFTAAVNELKKEGMQKMILDLRQNGGGFVDAATGVLDQLISGNKTLVYTQGSKVGKEEYKSAQTGNFESGRVVVLVDEATASASEIVAGAIQDWDRGVIIGRRTFGKGLVQEQYELGDGSALRLTIARYYTPVGRSIQRPYDKGREAYAADYQKRLDDESMGLDDEDTAHEKKYYTKEQHRLVYGGGGIRPDVVVPFVSNTYTNALYYLLNYPDVLDYVYRYYAYHAPMFARYSSLEAYRDQFVLTPQFMQQMYTELVKKYPLYTAGVWQAPNDLDFLKNYIKASFARMQFHDNGYYEICNEKDVMVQKAYTIINADDYSKIVNGHF